MKIVQLQSNVINSRFILTNLLFTGKKKYQYYAKNVPDESTHTIYEIIERNPPAHSKNFNVKQLWRKGRRSKYFRTNCTFWPVLHCHAEPYVTWMSSMHEIHLIHFLSDLWKLYMPGTNSDILQYLKQFKQSRPATFNIWLLSPYWSHNCPLPAHWKC